MTGPMHSGNTTQELMVKNGSSNQEVDEDREDGDRALDEILRKRHDVLLRDARLVEDDLDRDRPSSRECSSPSDWRSREAKVALRRS